MAREAAELMAAAANPFLSWVQTFADSLRAGAAIRATEQPRPPRAASGPKALIFAPHPDDEVIIGGLPLRLMRECGFAVTNVAVTLGSRADRRAGRWHELQAACATLGFGLITPDPHGLEGISPHGREQDPARWDRAVAAIAALIATERPRTLFLPHEADWNQTHIGAHLLVTEAMRRLPALACLVVETEFWGAMAAPNLLIESSVADVADLVAALSLHAGEVARNPYHLRLPAWMMDNVRRGAELVGGQGEAAPSFAFATLYRLRAWRDGGLHDVLGRGCAIGSADSLQALFTGTAGAAWR